MRKILMTLLLIFAGANPAHASDGYEGISRAAHRLENAAGHFHQQLRYDVGYDHAAKDARKFAKAARHFHRQVERGGSYHHIRNDYAELARAYAHVRQEFGGRHDLHHDRHFRGDFGEVERAFSDLERAIHYARSRSSPYRDYGHYDSGLRIMFRGVFGN